MIELTAAHRACKDAAHAVNDELCDVIALVEGARNAPFENQGESGDRLLRLALEKLRAAQTALDPHI